MQELRSHKKMTPNENSGSRMRTWQEEAETLLSLLNCFVLEREVVFASSEFFTGKRFYDLCLNGDSGEVDQHSVLIPINVPG
jgi:hypothetical protein